MEGFIPLDKSTTKQTAPITLRVGKIHNLLFCFGSEDTSTEPFGIQSLEYLVFHSGDTGAELLQRISATVKEAQTVPMAKFRMRNSLIMLRGLFLGLIFLGSAKANNVSSKPCGNKISTCCGGQPGTNGIPGMHGMPGSPGAPGRDGREGAKGDQGNPGKTGPEGPPGADGKKGANGEPGVQGLVGQKGERGEKGDSGTPGTPRLSSHMNWKECTWKKGDDKDSGVIQNCEFMKNFTETALHVYFDGNLRIRGCDNCCSRWYFTFNGAECSSPGPIDGAFYISTGKNHDLHRHRHIEGHCNNIHKGKVRVGFWVGNCNTGHKNADAYTGWATMSRIFIEEVQKAQQ